MEFDTTSVYLVSNFEGDRIINYAMKKCFLTGITIIITVVYPQLVESKQQDAYEFLILPIRRPVSTWYLYRSCTFQWKFLPLESEKCVVIIIIILPFAFD